MLVDLLNQQGKASEHLGVRLDAVCAALTAHLSGAQEDLVAYPEEMLWVLTIEALYQKNRGTKKDLRLRQEHLVTPLLDPL